MYGGASVSRINKMTGLFCKIALSKRRYSAKETYNLIDPNICSHPITQHGGWVECVTRHVCIYIYVYTYMCIYIHIYICICMYAYIYIHIYSYIFTYISIFIYMYACTFLYIYIRGGVSVAYLFARICKYIHRICIFLCIFAYILCMHIHTHTHKQTQTNTNTNTHTQTSHTHKHHTPTNITHPHTQHIHPHNTPKHKQETSHTHTCHQQNLRLFSYSRSVACHRRDSPGMRQPAAVYIHIHIHKYINTICT